jgi:hypothetical protein
MRASVGSADHEQQPPPHAAEAAARRQLALARAGDAHGDARLLGEPDQLAQQLARLHGRTAYRR